jgi:hypothetical protein
VAAPGGKMGEEMDTLNEDNSLSFCAQYVLNYNLNYMTHKVKFNTLL